MNMQPSEAEMGFNIRLPPTEHLELLKERIDNEWVPAYKNMTYKVKVFTVLPSNKLRCSCC
jgi:aminoacylase